MHFSTVAKALTHHHEHNKEETKDDDDPDRSRLSKTNTKSDNNSLKLSKTSTHASAAPFIMEAISSIDELEQILEDHHHKRVVIFCLTSTDKDLEGHDEAWYHQYAKLNNMHFVRVNMDEPQPLEEKLGPKSKPSWVTYHKGIQTGCSSGGLKRFMQIHGVKKAS